METTSNLRAGTSSVLGQDGMRMVCTIKMHILPIPENIAERLSYRGMSLGNSSSDSE